MHRCHLDLLDDLQLLDLVLVLAMVAPAMVSFRNIRVADAREYSELIS